MTRPFILAALCTWFALAGCSSSGATGGATPEGTIAPAATSTPATSSAPAATSASAEAASAGTTAPPAASSAALAAAVGQCPAGTSVAALDSKNKDVTAGGPFDLKTFTSAEAKLDKEGKRLTINVANKGMKPSALAKGEAIVSIVISDKEKNVAAGVYEDGSATFGKGPQVGVTLFAHKQAIGWSLMGSVNIAKMADGKVCGTFDLKGEFTDADKLTGTFVADLPK